MKRINLFGFLLLVLAFGSSHSEAALTPDQVLDKTRNAIMSARGISADFDVTASGRKGKGTLKSSGERFTVTMPDVQVWFNGKQMYTYNRHTRETTLYEPTSQELAETNPLYYVRNAKGNFSVDFSPVKLNGKYLIVLTPVKKNNDIKKLTVTVRSSDFIPEKIVAEPKNGGAIVIDISSFKTGLGISNSEFEYPKAKYPDAEIIDLR